MYLLNKVKGLNRTHFLLIAVVLIALVIRCINLKDQVLFAYDQARDAQRIYGMIYQNDIKIVGPETDIQGIFNGPLLYYVLAPIYGLSHFDPNAAALFFIVLNVATIFVIYHAAKLIFDKPIIGLVASIFWALSYEQGFFARYISNASPMSLTTSLFFLGVGYFFIRKKQWGLPFSAAAIALSIHCNFYFIYLFSIYPLFWILYRPKVTVKTVISSIFLLVVLLSPWIVTELRWHFVGTQSLLHYFFSQKQSILTHNPLVFISTMLTRYYNRTSMAIYYSFIPHRFVGFSIAALTVSYLVVKKRTATTFFFVIWIMNTLPLYLFESGVHSVEVINGSIFVPLTILFAFLIVELATLKVRKLPLFAWGVALYIIVYGAMTYIQHNFVPYSVFTAAPSLLINTKQVVDYTYRQAHGSEFGICSISEPLFINTVWSFLYSTYGKQKYGYVPSWTGQLQVLNKNLIPYAHKKYATKFIIQEPMQGIPEYAPIATYYIEDTQNKLVKQSHFGAYIVQQRSFAKENGGQYKERYTQQQIDKNDSIIHLEPRFSCDVTYE